MREATKTHISLGLIVSRAVVWHDAEFGKWYSEVCYVTALVNDETRRGTGYMYRHPHSDGYETVVEGTRSPPEVTFDGRPVPLTPIDAPTDSMLEARESIRKEIKESGNAAARGAVEEAW